MGMCWLRIILNIGLRITLPKGAKRKPYHSRVINADKTLNHEQVEKLIEGSKHTPIYLTVLFNVVMGMRCSEIIGVKYSDVDYIGQKLSVERQLGRDKNITKEMAAPKTCTKQEIDAKTSSSRRELDIPNIVFEAILEEKRSMKQTKEDEKITSKTWGIYVVVPMEDLEVKDIISSIISSY